MIATKRRLGVEKERRERQVGGVGMGVGGREMFSGENDGDYVEVEAEASQE